MSNLENIPPQTINLRNKGVKNQMGQLVKGCVKDATTKLSIGSIPSNYQSIIYKSESKKGFGTGQKRFHDSKSEMARTDITDSFHQEETASKVSVSESAKGSGAFASKQKREWIKFKAVPGPGKYEPVQTTHERERERMKVHSRRCYSREYRNEKVEEYKNRKEDHNCVPGPGEYQLREKLAETTMGWKSSFKTKMTRYNYINKSITPGPGFYQLLEKQHQNLKSPKEMHEPKERYHEENVLRKIGIKADSRITSPGPGAYEFNPSSFKPLYEKAKLLNNFIIPSKGRFGDKINQEEDPMENVNADIYSYNIKSGFDKYEEQRLIDSPCFMSETKRVLFKESGPKLGPNVVNLAPCYSKKNFHFNLREKWV